MTFEEILCTQPNCLSQYIYDEFTSKIEIPTLADNIESMHDLANLMQRVGNNYIYLSNMLMLIAPYVRTAKKNLSADEYHDMVDRRNILQSAVDIHKHAYANMSRLVTIKKEINDEMKMGLY